MGKSTTPLHSSKPEDFDQRGGLNDNAKKNVLEEKASAKSPRW